MRDVPVSDASSSAGEDSSTSASESLDGEAGVEGSGNDSDTCEEDGEVDLNWLAEEFFDSE
eukprot:1087245-Lingulodinium_polyedra.AAC.1